MRQPLKYPVTYQGFRVVVNGQTVPTDFETEALAMQYISSLSFGTVALLIKSVTSYSLLQTYGTNVTPLPAPPLNPIGTTTIAIPHVSPA